MGFEDLHDLDDVVDALARLRAARPGATDAIVKLNEGVSGRGNATVELRGLPAPGSADERAALRDRAQAMAFEHHEMRLERLPRASSREGGGIVEERVGGRRGPQPERAAARDAAGRGRAALDARPAPRRAERAELSGLPLPGRLRLRARDHRGGSQDRRPARLRGRARALRGRLRRGARRARATGIRTRSSSTCARAARRTRSSRCSSSPTARTTPSRGCSRPRADARSTSWRPTTWSRSSCAG